MSQVESALFDNHISSAFLLMSGAGIKDKIKRKKIRADEETEGLTKKANSFTKYEITYDMQIYLSWKRHFLVLKVLC